MEYQFVLILGHVWVFGMCVNFFGGFFFVVGCFLLKFQFCFVEPSQFSQTLNGVPPSNPVISGMDPFHACSILQQLKTMYDEGQLTDIVVEVDHGKTFSCHRNVLAAISPYFRYSCPLF